MSIKDRVIRVVCDQLSVKAEDLTESSSFINDLGADSLDTVELIMALEDEFKIEIQDAEAEKIETVGDAIDYAAKALETPKAE